MPLYDFRCRSCGERFEARAAADQLPGCPACGAPEAERQISGFAGPFKGGLRGDDARRSNSLRRTREERRLEERARRREERDRRGDRPTPRGEGPRE